MHTSFLRHTYLIHSNTYYIIHIFILLIYYLWVCLVFAFATRSSQAQLLQRSYTTCVVGLLHGYMRPGFVFDILKRWEKWDGWKGPSGERSGILPLAKAALPLGSDFAISFQSKRFCSCPVLLSCSRWLLPTTSCKMIFGDNGKGPRTYISYYI